MRVDAYLPSAATLYRGSGFFLAYVATEAAVRAIADVGLLIRGQGDVENVKYNLSANLGGVIFYGLCALNIVPATRLIGTAIFIGYSMYQSHRGWDEYLASKVIRTVTTDALPTIGKICRFAFNCMRHPTWWGVAILVGLIWLQFGTDFSAMQHQIQTQFFSTVGGL